MIKLHELIRIATALYPIYLLTHLKSGQLWSDQLSWTEMYCQSHKASHQRHRCSGQDFKEMGEGGDHFFSPMFLLTFREEGGKRGRERHPCKRETWIGCLPYAPQQGTEPETWACATTENEPATFPCTGGCSTNWDTPARLRPKGTKKNVFGRNALEPTEQMKWDNSRMWSVTGKF